MKLDMYALKGDYYTGFKAIKGKLGYQLVESHIEKEVINDIYEMLLRNQNNGKKFNEVIGGDINTFVDSVIESYYSTVSKTKFIVTMIKMGILFSIFGLVGPLLQNSPTRSIFLYSLIGFFLGSLIYILIYKVKKSFINPILLIMIMLFAFWDYRAVEVFNKSSVFLATEVSYGLIICIAVIELIVFLGLNKYLKSAQ